MRGKRLKSLVNSTLREYTAKCETEFESMCIGARPAVNRNDSKRATNGETWKWSTSMNEAAGNSVQISCSTLLLTPHQYATQQMCISFDMLWNHTVSNGNLASCCTAIRSVTGC